MSRQVVPNVLPEMLTDPDTAKADRAMNAMLKMKKLDIAELKRAFEGKRYLMATAPDSPLTNDE